RCNTSNTRNKKSGSQKSVNTNDNRKPRSATSWVIPGLYLPDRCFSVDIAVYTNNTQDRLPSHIPLLRSDNMKKYLAIAVALLASSFASAASTAAQGKFEVSPFVGYETSGSYPVRLSSNGAIVNPIDRLRANEATSYGTFLDYNLGEDFQAEFMWG